MKRTSITVPEIQVDETDPDGFRAGMARFGPAFGAEDTGATLYVLPPGKAVCPYHFEVGEEEWLLVVAGRPSVRTPEGVEELAVGDLVFFAKGPEGAHQIRNDTGEEARVLMWSTVLTPTATFYPDSDKVGVWTGDKATDRMLRATPHLAYYDGEA